jgi:hypothetical protein
MMTNDRPNDSTRDGVKWRGLTALALATGAALSGCVQMGHGMAPLPLVPLAYLNIAAGQLAEHVATVGKYPRGPGGGMVVGASDQFGKKELQMFYDRLNAPAFHAALARKHRDLVVPEFKFQVTLRRHTWLGGARRVDVDYSPEIPVTGPTRGLYFDFTGAVEKEYQRVEPVKEKP